VNRDNGWNDGQAVVVANEAVEGQGEDSWLAETDALGGLLCVADGCGGIGSRRYTRLENHTEAYMAARLAVACTRDWVAGMDGHSLPGNAEQAAFFAQRLAAMLQERLRDFHGQYQNAVSSKLVMRGLQRTLPTTLCAALVDARQTQRLSCVFYWAGDSRGYVLDADGLRQCTADHVAGRADALENLYRDARLSNMVNADQPFSLSTYGLSLAKPCAVITATDGAFGYLPTPMEFELLLLTTLEASADLEGWRNRLHKALRKLASDDSTLAIACFGAETFSEWKASLAGRRAVFQNQFVTPVRRRRQNVEYARGLWTDYRQHYERCEEVRDADWQL